MYYYFVDSPKHANDYVYGISYITNSLIMRYFTISLLWHCGLGRYAQVGWELMNATIISFDYWNTIIILCATYLCLVNIHTYIMADFSQWIMQFNMCQYACQVKISTTELDMKVILTSDHYNKVCLRVCLAGTLPNSKLQLEFCIHCQLTHSVTACTGIKILDGIWF